MHLGALKEVRRRGGSLGREQQAVVHVDARVPRARHGILQRCALLWSRSKDGLQLRNRTCAFCLALLALVQHVEVLLRNLHERIVTRKAVIQGRLHSHVNVRRDTNSESRSNRVLHDSEGGWWRRSRHNCGAMQHGASDELEGYARGMSCQERRVDLSQVCAFEGGLEPCSRNRHRRRRRLRGGGGSGRLCDLIRLPRILYLSPYLRPDPLLGQYRCSL